MYVNDTDLNKSKIMNINDFIFRQNLEFYPNLQGLKVENNILIYQEQEEKKISEPLTFDLRTLPGEVWNNSPERFLEIIRHNKECKKLYDFIYLLNNYAFETFVNPEYQVGNAINDIKEKTINFTNLYLKFKDEEYVLTEDNKILLANLDHMIASLPEISLMKTWINERIDNYYVETKTINDVKGKALALELKKNLPSLIEKEPRSSISKAGFINALMLIYGIANIGIILAIAFIRN